MYTQKERCFQDVFFLFIFFILGAIKLSINHNTLLWYILFKKISYLVLYNMFFVTFVLINKRCYIFDNVIYLIFYKM